jgi:hypothetical protein
MLLVRVSISSFLEDILGVLLKLFVTNTVSS